MGKYLDIARKFEAQKGAPDYRAAYHEAASSVREECFAIDPCWLLDYHPQVWEQLVALDNELTEMERAGAGERTYRAALSQLVACVRSATVLYEQARSAAAVQQ